MKAYRHIPVIMVTARTDKSVRLQALRVGIDDYMNKPFDEEEVLVRIYNLIHNYNARLELATPEGNNDTHAPVLLSDHDMNWLAEVEEYVMNNINDSLLSVTILSDAFNMSESSLRRQLKKLTGMNPSKYLQEHKLDKARSLLENKRFKSISEVAYSSGFQDAKAFSRSFKSRYGKSPSQYLMQ